MANCFVIVFTLIDSTFLLLISATFALSVSSVNLAKACTNAFRSSPTLKSNISFFVLKIIKSHINIENRRKVQLCLRFLAKFSCSLFKNFHFHFNLHFYQDMYSSLIILILVVKTLSVSISRNGNNLS